MQNMQLGVYDADADPPGHYHWHADQEWQEDPAAVVRILSVSVLLSDEYMGADFQVELLNASRTKGSAVVFPSYQIHRVHPITRGQRVSLVGWVMGRDPQKYWLHAQNTHDVLLQRESQMQAKGDQSFPIELKYQTVMILGSMLMRQENWARLLAVSAMEIDLAEQMRGNTTELADVSPGGEYNFHGENLAKALIRYSMAAFSLGLTGEEEVAKARYGCDRASRLVGGNDRALALSHRGGWEEYQGDWLRSYITKHEAQGWEMMRVSHANWVAMGVLGVVGTLSACVWCWRGRGGKRRGMNTGKKRR